MNFNPLTLLPILSGRRNPFSQEQDLEANPFEQPQPPEGYNPFTRSPENPFMGLPSEPPPTKKPTREMLRDILSNSLYAFGQGLLAASKAPVGSQSMAAFGAAVSAPYEREMAERKMRREEAQQALYEAQALRQSALAQMVGPQMDFLRAQTEAKLDQQLNALQLLEKRFELQGKLSDREQAFRLTLQDRVEALQKELEELRTQRAVKVQEMKPPRAPTQTELAIAAAQGDPIAAKALKELQAGRTPQVLAVQTVDAEGNPITRIVPKVISTYPAPPTSEQRNKEAAKAKVLESIRSIEALSKRVITEKGAFAQRMKATGRSIAAFTTGDPDYRTYQDARMALAGNLAVYQQGSRPSDADIRAIWLPLVPDPFRDNVDSRNLKWKIIKIGSGFSEGSFGKKDKVLMINPEGKKGYVPAGQVLDALQQGYRIAEEQ